MSAVNPRDERVGRLLDSEHFSFSEAVGGIRGLVESVLPGLVFVVAFLIWGGFRVPVIAAVAAVVVMVIARLAQRTPVSRALSGLVGVALGAVWAWRSGDAGGFFVPGLWINAGYLAAVLVSMAVRWPAAGVVVGVVRGLGGSWRDNPAWMRRAHLATAVLAGVFVLRLAVQVPLYLADQVAALGTAKLAMGLPLFALGLWVMWLLVRPVGLPPEPQGPPPPTR